MTFREELDTHLRARFTLLIVSTVEEERAVGEIKHVCATTGRDCVVWDLPSGFAALSGSAPQSPADPVSALEAIAKQPPEATAVFVLKDFHEYWNDARVKRLLRNTAQALRMTRTSIVVVTPESKVPRELADEAVQVDFDLPGADELGHVLETLARTPGLRHELTPAGRQRLVQAAIGLTQSQAHRAFSKAIVGDGILDDRDIDLVTRRRRRSSAGRRRWSSTPHRRRPTTSAASACSKSGCACGSAPSAPRPASTACPPPKGSR